MKTIFTILLFPALSLMPMDSYEDIGITCAPSTGQSPRVVRANSNHDHVPEPVAWKMP
jgi:hypothetical protein